MIFIFHIERIFSTQPSIFRFDVLSYFAREELVELREIRLVCDVTVRLMSYIDHWRSGKLSDVL